MSERKRWTIVVIFATAMAWVESAVVVYLRTKINRIEPYQPDPLPIVMGWGEIELVREVATLVMLCAVGWLAGRTARSRWAYAVMAFGVWDIFYYVWLKLMFGWPHSLLDWDILFLLPVPWWAPVLAPVLIALLMVVGGTLVATGDEPGVPCRPSRSAWTLSLLGALLALYVFMVDALMVLSGGVDAVRHVLPTQFNWPLFIVALALMLAPVVDVSRQRWQKRMQNSPSPQSRQAGRTALSHTEGERDSPLLAGEGKGVR